MPDITPFSLCRLQSGACFIFGQCSRGSEEYDGVVNVESLESRLGFQILGQDAQRPGIPGVDMLYDPFFPPDPLSKSPL
jgi:hypothetical protein